MDFSAPKTIILTLANRRILDEEGNPLYADEDRRPKRKVAVMIGYSGNGYHGMQLNPPAKTIEGELFKAFVEAGAISKNNSNDLKKSGFMRAARTDKGVHASGNVVSLKMIVEDEDIVEKINSHLPDQIRVWGYQRTNKAFDCRKMCSSRVYEYLIPTYSFLPPRPNTVLANMVAKAEAEFPGTTRKDPQGTQFWADVMSQLEAQGVTQDDIDQIFEAHRLQIDVAIPLQQAEQKFKKVIQDAQKEYRIDAERLDLIREGLKLYTGTHNFHNFTLGKGPKDPSAKRCMMSLKVSDPFLIDNTEWVSIKIHGQSFMLHQIRKMIGMVALVVRTGCPIERISEAFRPDKINIPKAPALGLLLEQPVYDGYNPRLVGFGFDPLSFDSYEAQMLAFKQKFIYDRIFKEEKEERTFHNFFTFIDGFNGVDNASGTPIFDFLTANGIQKKDQDLSEDAGAAA